jgi:hypothetical protein
MLMTKNDFAVLLVFYFYYFRTKLNKVDLLKVVQKYTRKSSFKLFVGSSTSTNSLLLDLYKKYTAEYYIQFTEAPYDEIIYILRRYYNDIPSELFTIIETDYNSIKPESWPALSTLLPSYQNVCDVYSDAFLPEKLLGDGLPMIGPVSLSEAPAVDNLSKAMTLLPEGTTFEKSEKIKIAILKEQLSPEDILKKFVETSSASIVFETEGESKSQMQSNKSLQEIVYEKRQSDKEKEQLIKSQLEQKDKRHILEIIASISIPKHVSTNTKGERITLFSPLSLLENFMKDKVRVRIVTRRQNR